MAASSSPAVKASQGTAIGVGACREYMEKSDTCPLPVVNGQHALDTRTACEWIRRRRY